MIPCGFHIIHWRNTPTPSVVIDGPQADRVSPVASSNGFLPLMGSHLFIERSQVIVRKWDEKIEDLEPLNEEEEERYIEGVRRMDFDQGLGAFPNDESYITWKQLTSCISKNVYEFKMQNLQLKFEKIPSRWMPSNPSECVGSDRTQYFLDKSYLLHHLIEKRWNNNWDYLVGEFQLSFVSFWVCESYESFEHWKDMMILFCGCENSLEEYSDKWIKIIDTISLQLEIVPADFFDDILSSKNFLLPCLKSIMEILSDNSLTSTNLYPSYQKLKSTVENRFDRSFLEIDFDDEDEFAPTIVEL